MINTTDLSPTLCFHCGHILDSATSTKRSEGPVPGDISVCLYCGHVAILGDDRRLRPPTDEEIVIIAGDPHLLAVQKIVGEFRKKITKL